MNTIEIGQEFVATFVPANSGLQTAQRVNGRRTFPDRKGPQPKDGEKWSVKLSGQNPSGTVHFVVCLSRIEETPVTVAAPKPAKPVHATVKTAAGHTAYERALSWLTPVKSVGLADLAFVMAQKQSLSDGVCLALRGTIQGLVETVDESRKTAARLKGRFEEQGRWDSLGESARELVTARDTMKKLLDDKAVLSRDTLDYARLCKQVKAQPEGADSTLADQAAAVKATLDARRSALKTAIEEAQQALRRAEDNRYWSHDQEVFDELCQNLAEQEEATRTESRLVGELEQAVAALEARLVEVRNGK